MTSDHRKAAIVVIIVTLAFFALVALFTVPGRFGMTEAPPPEHQEAR